MTYIIVIAVWGGIMSDARPSVTSIEIQARDKEQCIVVAEIVKEELDYNMYTGASVSCVQKDN